MADMKLIAVIFFGLIGYDITAQINVLRDEHTPLKFIDKVEIFVGPSLCFNHGSMFTENYKGKFANGNFVENKRLTKMGFSIGIGAYHPINDKVDINVGLMWEQKGYKSELNNPLFSIARAFTESDYTYNYLTLPLTAKVVIDKKRRIAFSLGGYISQLSSVRATEKFYNTLDNMHTESSFIGRTIVGFNDDGGINTASFLPGLQSFSKYDYGLILGFSYQFNLVEKNRLVIQLVDNFGLANVNDPKKNFTTLPSPYERNHTVSLLVGYVYHRKPNN